MLKALRIQNLRRILFVTQSSKSGVYNHQSNTLKSAQPNCAFMIQQQHFYISAIYQKYNKKSTQDADSDEDDDDLEFKDERDSKVVKTKVNSLRADLLLKAGLGMARNKVENFFYDSKIRVNGRKLPKKSVQLTVGDEIDVIRGFSQSNTSHIIVSRVVILAANEREDATIGVQLRRYKSLLIENYAGQNVYKSSEISDHLA